MHAREEREEEQRIRYLRQIVEFTMCVIAQSDIPIEEASRMVASTKKLAIKLFPEKEEVFDLVYGSRFKRLLTEKYGLH
ncbi:MAG: hypothetical protein HY878_00550 [Deltaproteobacteria bacterium]|nr:hypothetical protein [Deltaproteobacteria bacterium]